jgi:putative membrane protein
VGLAEVFIGLALMLILSFLPGVHIALVLSLVSGMLSPEALMLMYGSFSALVIIQTVIYAYAPGEAAISLPLVHRFLNQGRLKEYVFCWLAAGFIGLILSLAIPGDAVRAAATLLKPASFYLVLLVLFLNVAFNRRIGWVLGLLLSGAIGYIGISWHMDNPFMPIFTGLFALPFLVGGMSGRTENPVRPAPYRLPDAGETLKGAVLGVLLALVSFGIPAVGAPSAMGAFAYPLLKDVSMLSFFSSFSASQYFMSFEGMDAGAPRVSATIQLGNMAKGNELWFIMGYAAGALLVIAVAEPIYKSISRSRAGYALAAAAISLAVAAMFGIGGIALMLASYIVGSRFYDEKTSLLGAVIIPYLAFSL